MALAETVDLIESALHTNEYALVLFMDIKGAFDNLNQEAAIEAMRNRNLPNWFVDWYEAYLALRTATVTMHGIKTTRWIPKGSPQGGVYSPTFWNIAFDELLAILNNNGGRGVGFADDAHTRDHWRGELARVMNLDRCLHIVACLATVGQRAAIVTSK